MTWHQVFSRMMSILEAKWLHIRNKRRNELSIILIELTLSLISVYAIVVSGDYTPLGFQVIVSAITVIFIPKKQQ